MIVVDWKADAGSPDSPASKPRRVGSRRRPALRPRPELLEGRLVLDSGGGWSTLSGASLPPALFSSPPTTGTYVQEARLTPPVAGDWLNYGWGASLTADGETLAIGAPGGGAVPGAVYVYERDGGGWTETARLAMPAGVPGERFGQGVAISGDGSTLAVTSRLGDWATGGASLHIYSRSGFGWNLSQTITLEASHGFGGWLSISDDGGVVVGGAAFHNSIGAAYVFSRVDGVYAMEPPVTSPDGTAGDWLGEPAALSGDGRTLVLGSGYRTVDGVRRGAIYVFERSEGGWDLATTLMSPPGVVTGLRVAINGDGSVLLAREQREGQAGPIDAGVVYTKSGSTWSRSAELSDPEPASDAAYGDWVALSPDGLTAVVGAPFRRSSEGAPAGAAYVFSKTGTTWEQIGRLADLSGESNDRFGMGAVIRGRTIVVAAPNADAGDIQDQGAVFVFQLTQGLVVSAEPVDRAGRPLSLVTFTAAAAGAEGITSRWQVSRDAGATWTDIPLATGPSLSLKPTLADSGNRYRAVFTDGGGATVVSRAALLTVAEATPVVTIVAAPSRWNEAATFTVRVATDGSTPLAPGGGAVTFRAGSFVATSPLVNGVATFVVQRGTFAPGVVLAQASYDGEADPVFGSSGGTLQHSVLRAATSLTLSRDVAAPHFGQAILVTAGIAYDGAGLPTPIRPTGVVQFTGYGRVLGNADVATTQAATLAEVATFAFEREGNAIAARYMGDDWYEPSVAAMASFDTPPTPTDLSVYTPAGTLATFGDAIVYRVAVAENSYYGAAGELRIEIEDDAGNVRELTYAMPQGGTTQATIAGLAVGTNRIRFSYVDPTGMRASGEATAVMGIWKSPASVELASSAPVSQNGREVVFTATVREPKANNPVASGLVDFYVGDRLVATSAVDSLGRARLTTSALVPGSYTLTAVYRGSESYRPAQSAGLAQRVEPLPVAPKPITSIAVSADPGSSVAGREVTFTATVLRADGGRGPTSGLVSFYIGGALVAYAPIGADGRATLTTSALVPGVYGVSASFPESADLWGSQSAPIVHVVTPGAPAAAATTTALTSTRNPAAPGQALAFVAQVSGPAGSPRPTSGVVRFYLGADAIAERPIDANGRATLEARFDEPGGHLVTAVFLGGDGFATSQSDHLGQVVASPIVPAATAAPEVPTAPPAGAAVPPWVARRAARAERLARLAQRRPPAMRFRG